MIYHSSRQKKGVCTLTPDREELLKELLAEVATEGGPAGFIPDSCLIPFYKLTRTPFIELIIYRVLPDGEIEYLYQDRHDKWWEGFCAFGGMVRANFPATPLEVAQKLIDREFKGANLRVTTLRIVSYLNWPEHPWCNPFALVNLITVNGDIPESADRHWLSLKSLPGNMIVNHAGYLEQCEYFLTTGELVFTPDQPNGIPVPSAALSS